MALNSSFIIVFLQNVKHHSDVMYEKLVMPENLKLESPKTHWLKIPLTYFVAEIQGD